MKTKIFLLALLLACITHESHSMFKRLASRAIITRKAPTFSLGQKQLLQERLEDIRKKMHIEVAIIDEHTPKMIFSYDLGVARSIHVAEARNRYQDLDKQFFDIKMKLEKK